MQGNRAVELNAKDLEAQGEIKTAGDLAVNLKDSFTLNHAFEVGNNLTFKTEGDFSNNAVQRVANKLAVTANQIANSVNAELSGNETNLNTQQLTNRGLIDGNKTFIDSTKVTNIGTGRIYGSHLAIKADTVENLAETINGESKAGTIAARSRLDFGVNKLINRDHALILSLGEAGIGGDLDANHQAVGKTGLLDNGSATIEVLGEGKIHTAKLLNHDLYLKLGVETSKPEDIEEMAPESRPTERYRVGVDGSYDWFGRDVWFYFYDSSKPTIKEKQFYVWRYKRTTHTPFIEKQDKAIFNIGGDLHLKGDDLRNKYSQLTIGRKLFLGDKAFTSNPNNGDLSANGMTLHNEDIPKEIRVEEKGAALFLEHYKKHDNDGHRHKVIDGNYNHSYSFNSSFNAVSNTIGTPVTSNANIGDKAQVKDVQLDSVSLIANEAGKLSTNITLVPTINNNDVVGSGQVIAKLQTTLANMTMPMVKTQLAEVHLPQASIYKINPNHPQGYLVETDPRFTDRQQWLSSDYMLNELRYAPEVTQKRLGDGFYEQRLVNEQVNQLTGRRYIEGYNNDIEQYRALMNNGVKYAKQFNLNVGVGLTAKQMSELTTDMVWLVNKEVTLVDGRKVTALVPQVYLVARNSDITSFGAVISANEIGGKVNNLQNSGVIAGRDLTRIHSNQLENRGTILGETVDLSAKQTLVNLGGKMIEELAHQLAKEKGGTTKFWQEQLTLVASAMTDEQQNQQVTQGINAILNDTVIYNLDGYKENLVTAYDTLKNEANKNQAIKWKDGSNVVLYGENVNMFQATEKQYKDSSMFGKINYPTVTTIPKNNLNSLNEIGSLNGLSANSNKYSAELLGNIGQANRNRQDNNQVLNNTYYNYVVAPKGIAEPVAPELYVIGGAGRAIGKATEKVAETATVLTKQASSKVGAFADKYPNTAGALTDGFIAGGIHTGYKISTGQDVDGYELAGAFAGGALTRNHTIGNQIRINIGVATVSSLSKDPSGNSLSNDYWGAVTSPFASKIFENVKFGNILGGYSGEYIGDLEKRKKDILEIKNMDKEVNNE